MANDRITSLEVAKGAGVSQSAVSRVFTPGASVSKITREKVLRAARELGYRPNVLARAMITGKSRIIGLVVAYLDNQFVDYKKSSAFRGKLLFTPSDKLTIDLRAQHVDQHGGSGYFMPGSNFYLPLPP